MNHQWWHKVSPPGMMIQVGAVIPWEQNSGSELMSPREGTAAAMEQQLVWAEQSAPQRAARKGSHPVHDLKRKEETSPAIYFSPLSIIYTSLWETSLSTIEFLRLKSDFTHRPGRPTFGSSTSPTIGLLFEVTDFVPLPQTRQCLGPALQIVLFSRDVRQDRKRSLLFSSLCIQGLPA